MNKQIAFVIFVIALLMLLPGLGFTSVLANEYDAIVANSIIVVEKSESLNEMTAFASVRLSPDSFMETIGNDVERIYTLLGETGVDISQLPRVSSAQEKRFTFSDVLISNELSDVQIIRCGEDPVYLSFVFVYVQGQWLLIDVLCHVESFEILNGLTNTWLKTTAYAFQSSVEIEGLYNLSTRAYEVCYLSHAAYPAYDLGLDDVVYASGHSTISEYSVIEDTESVYYCYLYVVRNASVCSWESTTINERYAVTEIDIYRYDYDNGRFAFLQTNRYEGISAATIESILRNDVLLDETSVVKHP